MQCSFPDETMCQMTSCSQSGLGWEMVTNVTGGPMSDHTNLPSGSGEQGKIFKSNIAFVYFNTFPFTIPTHLSYATPPLCHVIFELLNSIPTEND